MKTKINKYNPSIGVALLLLLFMATGVQAQSTDSLSYYLQTAAHNNPSVNSGFALYKASLEKVPQAGAFADPELEIGFFIKPMEQLEGKQVADFTLMQMFPWFGTRKAARNEATEMARMAYEQFRESRNNLYYEVKSQWYQLSSLNEQYKNTAANLALLTQLEQLALNRYAAPSAKGQTSGPVASPASTPVAPSAPSSGSGMGSMDGMGGVQSAQAPAFSASAMSGMGGNAMRGGSMGSNSSGTMSDVLRIQMEKAELINTLETIRSTRKAGEAKFNTLLNRNQNLPVSVPDSLTQLLFSMDDTEALDSITTLNPMLTMLEAEANAYKAKAEMDKKMSLPMFGIGLQYSVMAKKAEEMNNSMSMSSMNGMDMVMPMVKISIPIFRKKYNAQQRENKQYHTASELKYEATHNQLQAEYTTIKLQLSDAARKVSLYSRQHELSLSAYQLMVREFSAGATSLTDVIQVERQLLDYSLKKSEAIAAYNTLIAGLEKLISTSVNE